MKASQMAAELDFRPAWDDYPDKEITGGYTSDLLSDVMAHAEEGQILITIQAHKNTVAVAVLKDLSGLVIASDRPLPEDMIAAAKDEGIPIFVTSDNQYTVGWRIHEILGN